MGKKSRNKGNRQERKLAKDFSSWWGTEFARTPLSGGFSTATFREDWNAAGDLVTPDEAFPFCVESKNVEGWRLEQLLLSSVCLFYKWWQQTVEETPEGKIPLLVFTKNYAPEFFAIYRKDCTKSLLRKKVFSIKHKNSTIVIGLLDDFFKTDPLDWKE